MSQLTHLFVVATTIPVSDDTGVNQIVFIQPTTDEKLKLNDQEIKEGLRMIDRLANCDKDEMVVTVRGLGTNLRTLFEPLVDLTKQGQDSSNYHLVQHTQLTLARFLLSSQIK